LKWKEVNSAGDKCEITVNQKGGVECAVIFADMEHPYSLAFQLQYHMVEIFHILVLICVRSVFNVLAFRQQWSIMHNAAKIFVR